MTAHTAAILSIVCQLRKFLKKGKNYENNLIDSDSTMTLTVNSLMEINNIITGSNNII